MESTDTSLLQFRSGSLDTVGVAPDYFSLLKKQEKQGNFKIYEGGPATGSREILKFTKVAQLLGHHLFCLISIKAKETENR